MGFFDNIEVDESIEVGSDTLRGSFTIPTGIYKGKIEMAHSVESQHGAKGIRVVFNLLVDNKPRTLEETFYITNREGKTFTISKDGTRRNMGGYDKMQSLSRLLLDKDLLKLNREQRPVAIRNNPPKMVDVFVELLNQNVSLAIFEVKENARAKNAKGEYVNTNDTRLNNEIDKIFDAQGFTLKERQQKEPSPKFALEWKNRYGSEQVNRFKEVAETGAASSSGSTGAALDFG